LSFERAFGNVTAGGIGCTSKQYTPVFGKLTRKWNQNPCTRCVLPLAPDAATTAGRLGEGIAVVRAAPPLLLLQLLMPGVWIPNMVLSQLLRLILSRVLMGQ